MLDPSMIAKAESDGHFSLATQGKVGRSPEVPGLLHDTYSLTGLGRR